MFRGHTFSLLSVNINETQRASKGHKKAFPLLPLILKAPALQNGKQFLWVGCPVWMKSVGTSHSAEVSRHPNTWLTAVRLAYETLRSMCNSKGVSRLRCGMAWQGPPLCGQAGKDCRGVLALSLHRTCHSFSSKAHFWKSLLQNVTNYMQTGFYLWTN